VSLPAYVNNVNEAAAPVTVTGVSGDTVAYTISNGSASVSASGLAVPSGNALALTPSLSTLADGTLTVVVTETDALGNKATSTLSVVKNTATPATPTVA